MGVTKYSQNIVIESGALEAFDEIKSLLKSSAYPIQYENKEKFILIARIEQVWLAPAGELMIFDLKEINSNKTEIIVFSKDLTNSGTNFNRNVKNVERFIMEIINRFTKK